MKSLFRNPMSMWLIWWFRSRSLMRKNSRKHLQIGYLSTIKRVTFGNYLTLYDHVFIADSDIGNFVYVSKHSSISNASIGSYCSIGPHVSVGLGKHPTDFISTFPAFFSDRKQCQVSFADQSYFTECEKVTIGNDVWLGARAIVLDGVTIGDGAIVAAGSVVSKNVAPYTIVGGIPAKPIKKRFSDEKITELLHLKWWEKDENWIRENSALFQAPVTREN
jgi:acetyltransferase-like isoleucine patch superfamily enzyme